MSDLIGREFGMLRVLDHAAPNAFGQRQYVCQCKCGQTLTVRGNKLTSSGKTHCGCLGYRRSSEAHQAARAKVPARRRKAIARMGAEARHGAD